MSKPVVLTGLRSNAEFHLGNYLGGILPIVDLQHQHAGQYQVNMFIPDLHSFTTPVDHGQLYRQSIDNLKVLVAAGLDIKQPDTFLYRQSYIPAHSELTWILSCFTYFGELNRMTQFKEKSSVASEELVKRFMLVLEQKYPDLKKALGSSTDKEYEIKYHRQLFDLFSYVSDTLNESQKRKSSAGLFQYPILMASDILLYGAQWVPVGEDQRQHLELTRDLAIRVNNKFGELFTVPHEWDKQLDFVKRDHGVRVRSLKNPEKKMSKSIDDPTGTILLSDNQEEAAKKVMAAATDSEGIIKLDWDKQPGISNLLQISALLAGRSIHEIAKEWEGKTSYGELKSTVADQVKDFLTQLQTKLNDVNEQELVVKLENDENMMRETANQTLVRVQKAVGLRPR